MSECIERFIESGFVVIPSALSTAEVEAMNESVDRDRAAHPKLWPDRGSGRHQPVTILLDEQSFDISILHPKILPIVRALLGDDACFEEHSVMLREPVAENPPDPGWHRDIAHGPDHPYCLRNLSLVYYLTDVDETTHCFSIVPESLEEKSALPNHRDGSTAIDIHGPAGTAILFNAANVHDARRRVTTQERRTIHIYYGHRAEPSLSEYTIFPPRLMDHEDPEVRALFSRPNGITARISRSFS